MTDDIKYDLDKEEPGEFHQKILTHCLQLVKMGRGRMSNFYEGWDRNAAVYKGLLSPNKEDRIAERKGEPARMTVPLTFAQVQTFVSFCFLLFNQNSQFYSLQPTGNEDFPIREDAEKFLARDLKRNQFLVSLYQWLLDIGRFNLGIFKHSWIEDYTFVNSTILRQPSSFLGVQHGRARLDAILKKVLRFEGNKIVPVSPYRFYPDLRLPITRFQDGEFCGSEDEISVGELLNLQEAGDVAGIDWVKPLTSEFFRDRVGSRFSLNDSTPSIGIKGMTGAQNSPGMAVLDEVQVKLVPSKFLMDNGKPMGTENYQVVYNVWIVNDVRVVKCEPLGYLHGNFTYDLAQFSPDQHEVMGEGLSDIIDHLQSVISWFVNSHISSVRKVVDNRLVVDPAGIDRKSLEDRSPVIYLKKGKSASGVDRWIKQLQVNDVTQNHMNDVEVLTKLMQLITGVNDNAMGQYNSGRRSATEARAVTAGAASRLKTSAIVIWAMALDPLGRKLLTNLRQGIQQETFARVVGRPMPLPTDQTDPNFQVKLQAAQQSQANFQKRWDAFKGTPEELVGADDFFVFDSTLPSEKGFIAQSLQELLGIILTNPATAQALDINAKSLLEEIYKLRGVPNFERFSLSATLANQAPRIVPTGSQPTLPPIIPISSGQPTAAQA